MDLGVLPALRRGSNGRRVHRPSPGHRKNRELVVLLLAAGSRPRPAQWQPMSTKNKNNHVNLGDNDIREEGGSKGPSVVPSGVKDE